MKLHTILFIALLILTTAYVARTRYYPGTSDSYWHMSIGRYVFQEHKIPDHSPFVFAYENTNFISTEWLAGLIYYIATLSPFGLAAVLILRMVLTVLTLFIFKKTVDLVSKNQLLNLAATAAIAYLSGFRATTDRPELISYLFLAFVNYVSFHFWTKGKLSKLTYLLPLIFLGWPNIHAFGILGAAILIAFIFCSFIDKKKRKTRPFLIFTTISLISITAAAIQFERFFYFLLAHQIAPFDIKELASIPSRLSEIKYSPITQTPPEIYFYFLTATALLSFTIWAITTSIKKRNYSQLLLDLFFLALILVPIKYFRLIAPAALLTLPRLVEIVAQSIKNNLAITMTSATITAVAVILMLWSTTVGFIVGSRNNWQYISDLSTEEKKIIGVRNHSWTDDYPYKTNKAIDEFLAPSKIFTSNPWRNYYIWYYPEVKIPSDVIFEYQTKQGFDDEEKVRFGQDNWQEVFEKYNADTVINASYEVSFPNVTPLHTLPEWKLVYVDEISYIYAKEEAIKKQPLDLSALQPELNAPIRFNQEKADEAAKQLQSLLDFDNNNLYARQQLILYYQDFKNDYQKAYDLAREGYKIAPQYPYFSLFLAQISAIMNNCTQAENWGRETRRSSFNDIIFKNLIKIAIQSCK